MIQIALAVCGLTAMFLALSEQPGRRKWAPLVGLAGQPFWFMATIPTEQWGMVALCVAYSGLYIRGIALQWRMAWFRRLVCRLTLLILSPVFIWDAPSRVWWRKRFKNGGL